MGGKAVQTAPATWLLVLVRSTGPPLVAAAVLAVARPPWPQWAAHAFFLVLLVPVAILTVDRVFGGEGGAHSGYSDCSSDQLARSRPGSYDTRQPEWPISGVGIRFCVSSTSLAFTTPVGCNLAVEARARTETAVVRMCLAVPDTTQQAGVSVLLNGAELPAPVRERKECPGGTWFRTPVTRKQLESIAGTATVELQREAENLTRRPS